MSYPMQQPGAVVVVQVESGDWKSGGICEAPCKDGGNCCMSFCCPWFRFGATVSAAGLMPYAKAAGIFFLVAMLVAITRSVSNAEEDKQSREMRNNGESFRFGANTPLGTVMGIISSIASVGLLVWRVQTRAKLRRQYGIQQGPCGSCDDCCCTFWCGCCTLAQEGAHVDIVTTGHIRGCDCSEPQPVEGGGGVTVVAPQGFNNMGAQQPQPAYGQPVMGVPVAPQQAQYGQPAAAPYGQQAQYGQPAAAPYGQQAQYGQPAAAPYGQPGGAAAAPPAYTQSDAKQAAPYPSV